MPCRAAATLTSRASSCGGLTKPTAQKTSERQLPMKNWMLVTVSGWLKEPSNVLLKLWVQAGQVARWVRVPEHA
jgi:hypothetical protein